MSAAKTKATAPGLADSAHRGLKLRVRRVDALWKRLNAALEVRKDRGFLVNMVEVPASNVSWLAGDIRDRIDSLARNFKRPAPDLLDAACAAMAGATYANVVHAATACDAGGSAVFGRTDADDAEAEIARKLCEQLTALATAIDAANPEVG